ncbi:hypothetical protein [Sphingomonas sp. 10B4]|uniref:hypothetical protein n=1 Tax=Sphingomonas sp. 10B4 TaxID=3048575 RepID=UPI002AB3EE40|nr:hypothetical protein [Sphingomonas sp. 10B4]MDY7525366.1 hypothetical protein [Sphingomonas sp. 10B4]MEB0284168.1 hypothetical protein [Sphingomonas sp. 10B4]
MTGLGELFFVIAIFAMIAPPVERALTHHRSARVGIFESTFAQAFPVVPPSPSLDALTQQAEDALEQDDLSRGIIATAATYDHADDGAPEA